MSKKQIINVTIHYVPQARSRQAFSLVELLVVVGIITLLAAILFPVFNSVKASGRRANCASNLKQIGVALSMYAQDNRLYPFVHNNPGEAIADCSGWANKLFPYIKANGVFECPSSKNGRYRPDCPATSDANGDPISYRGSYDLNIPDAAFNLATSSTPSSMTYPRGSFGPVRYTRPSSTIQVLDGDGHFVSPGYQEPQATDTTTLANYGVDAHHEGGLNVAFADGHVKYLSMDALLKRSLWRLNGPED